MGECMTSAITILLFATFIHSLVISRIARNRIERLEWKLRRLDLDLNRVDSAMASLRKALERHHENTRV